MKLMGVFAGQLSIAYDASGVQGRWKISDAPGCRRMEKGKILKWTIQWILCQDLEVLVFQSIGFVFFLRAELKNIGKLNTIYLYHLKLLQKLYKGLYLYYIYIYI